MTNFHGFYARLRELGFYVEVLRDSFLCFSAKDYSTIMIVDPEEHFTAAEVTKLQQDIVQHGLNLFLVADWYNPGISAMLSKTQLTEP